MKTEDDWPEPIATLLRDHQMMRGMLKELEYAVGGRRPDEVRKVADRLEGVIAHHAVKEERGLFPFLMDEETAEVASPLYLLMTEHQEIARHVARVRETLERGEWEPTREASEALAEFLLHHFATEEASTFPWIVQRLTEEELRAACRHVEHIARLAEPET